MKIKTLLLHTLGVLVISTYSLLALAEPAAMPIGKWDSDKNSTLNVSINECSYSAPAVGVNVTGNCEWKPTSLKGGILTINYKTYTATNIFENPLYFDLELIDDKTILVFKERYHKIDN